MGEATTFADLIAAPASEKVFLLEASLAEVVTNFTKTSLTTNTYQISYLNETITMSDGSTETVRKAISACKLDGVSLSARASIALVDANHSSYWHDTANGLLYVHAPDSGSPNGHTVVAYFWAYFATRGIVLDGRYYEPYIAQNGIPQLSQETQQIHWGASQMSAGTVTLLNGRGFFDQIARRWIWQNRDVRVLLGGDALAYAEYTCVFSGRIMQTRFTEASFTLDIESKSFALLRNLPDLNYSVATYANLDPAAEGRPIPYFWGSYSAAQAPLCTCIDTAYGSGVYKFKISDCTYHALKSITQIYVDYGDGAGWQTIAHANEDLTNGTFTISSATFVLGTTRVKASFEGYHSGGILIEGAPEIVEDILLHHGYSAPDLNAASFTASKAASSVALNVAVVSQQPTLSIIEMCCQSDLAYFDEDGDGLLRYRTWEPLTSSASPALAKEEIIDPPEIVDDTSKLYWKVQVGYGQLVPTGEYLYTEASNAESKYRYGREEFLTIKTYLRAKADADILAGRLNWITRSPSPIISIRLKAGMIKKALGDKIRVTISRAPYETAGGYVEREFEITSRRVSCFPLFVDLKARDARNFGANVGFWMADTAPDWASATDQQRDDSGFWTDDSGLADPSDPSSKNKSLWW